MELKFKIIPPNFVITDKGKFSLADLDSKEFNNYIFAYRKALVDRREQQKNTKKEESE